MLIELGLIALETSLYVCIINETILPVYIVHNLSFIFISHLYAVKFQKVISNSTLFA